VRVTKDIESIQAAIAAGDADASERLLPLVYDELRQLARKYMRREAAGHSLQTTELVHEAYLRLLGPRAEGGGGGDWSRRGPFLAAATVAMRRILVDRARARGAAKRGGDRKRLDLLELAQLPADSVSHEVLDLDEALTRLAQEEPEKAELVSLRFFGGLTLAEAAAVLGISLSTADRYWAYARAWLLAAMEGEV
jgi:RNA polymerase sigma factor (TIGR02999 family)